MTGYKTPADSYKTAILCNKSAIFDCGSIRRNGELPMKVFLQNFGCTVHAIDTDGKQHLVKMRLYEIEQLLPNYFVRINKSAIANQSQIAKFKASFSGAVDVIFKCGHVDYVSRRCFSEIKRRYQL